MSWAIAAGNHGTGEYMLLTDSIYVGSGGSSDFDIEFEYKITDPTAHARPFGRIGNFYSRVLIFANSNEIRFSGNDGSAANFFPTNYDKTVFNKYRFNRVDKRIYFYLNDVFVSDAYLDKAVLISALFTQNSGGQERSGAELKYFKMSVNNVDVIHLDASASDHSYTSGEQPVLVDTIGTNHALGMGFDLDASMWIDYGGSATRLARTMPVSFDLSARLNSQAVISSDLLSRLGRSTQIYTDVLQRIENQTPISFDVLYRKSNTTPILFDLDALALTTRLSNSVPITFDALERKANPMSVVFDVLSRHTNSVSISTDVLNRLANDVSIIADLSQRKLNTTSISLDLIERKSNQYLIQFSLDGEASTRVQLTQKPSPRVQLTYLVNNTEVVSLTPITPTRITLQ